MSIWMYSTLFTITVLYIMVDSLLTETSKLQIQVFLLLDHSVSLVEDTNLWLWEDLLGLIGIMEDKLDHISLVLCLISKTRH